jgi:hypothetical protein
MMHRASHRCRALRSIRLCHKRLTHPRCQACSGVAIVSLATHAAVQGRYNPCMATLSLAQRYIGIPLYGGSLLDEPGLDWLQHRAQPRGLSFVCLLPGCRRRLMRTRTKKQAYYCPGHARTALNRRRILSDYIAGLEEELARVPTGATGRHTTRRGRELQADLVFLRRILATYADVSEQDVADEDN